MANQKISDLTQASPLQDADMIPVVQIENSVPVTKKTTISDIKSAIGGDFLPLDGSKHMTGNLIFANNFNENLNQGIVWYTSDAMSSITSPDHFSIVIDAADSGNIILTTDEGDVTVDNRVDKFNINSDNFNVNSNNFNVKCDISVNTNFTLTRGTHNDILHQDDHYTYLSNSHGDDLLTSYYYGTSVVDNTVCLSRGYNDVLSQSKQWTFLSNSQGNDLLTSYYDGVTTANNQLTISRGGANDVLIQYKNDTLLSDSNGGDLLGSSISNGTGTQYNNVNLFASGDPVISAQRDSSHTENSTVTFSRCGYNDVLSQDRNYTSLFDSNGDQLIASYYDGNDSYNDTIVLSRGGANDVLSQDKTTTTFRGSNGNVFLQHDINKTNDAIRNISLQDDGDQIISAQKVNGFGEQNTILISRVGSNDVLSQNEISTLLYDSHGDQLLIGDVTNDANSQYNMVSLCAAGDNVLTAGRDSSHMENCNVVLSRCGYSDVLSQYKDNTYLFDSNGDNLLQSTITNGTGTQYNDVYLYAGGNPIISAHRDMINSTNDTVTLSRCGVNDVLFQDKGLTRLRHSDGSEFLTSYCSDQGYMYTSVTLSRGNELDILTQDNDSTKFFDQTGDEVFSYTIHTQYLRATSMTFDCPTDTTASAVYVRGADYKLKAISLHDLKVLLANTL